MAKARVVYKTEIGEFVCFKCAVLRSLNGEEGIHLSTYDYEYNRCEDCDNYIYDEIDI